MAVWIGVFRGIELYVIAYEEIEMAVAVVIEESAARAPANVVVVYTGFFGDVGEGAVTVVVKQNVVTPEAAEEVVPAIVIVIADTNTSLPTGARESGPFRDVGKCPVAIIFVEMRSRRLPG